MEMKDIVVGTILSDYIFEVRQEDIRGFMEATEDPMLYDEDEHNAYIPPTFPITFHLAAPEAQGQNEQVLLLEQKYIYERSIRVGEKLRCIVRIADAYEIRQKEKTALFAVYQMTGSDEKQSLVFTAYSTVQLVRQ